MAAFMVGDGVSSNGAEAFYWTSQSGLVGLGDLAGGDFASNAKDASFRWLRHCRRAVPLHLAKRHFAGRQMMEWLGSVS